MFDPPPPLPLLAAAALVVDCAAAVAEFGPDVIAGLEVGELCDVLAEESVLVREVKLELVDDVDLDDVDDLVEEAEEEVVLELEPLLAELVVDAAFEVEEGAIAEVKAEYTDTISDPAADNKEPKKSVVVAPFEASTAKASRNSLDNCILKAISPQQRRFESKWKAS